MRIVREEVLTAHGDIVKSPTWLQAHEEIRAAVATVVWPKGSKRFTIYPESGKKRGEGNGVVPIKVACMGHLYEKGWHLEHGLGIGVARGTGALDAVKDTAAGCFAVEWETGNISSSHRALNKIYLGILGRQLAAGVLILPTRKLYRYLTDRIGNYEELEPYFPLWKSINVQNGVVLVIVVEHDAESFDVPRIAKGTDGRALM